MLNKFLQRVRSNNYDLYKFLDFDKEELYVMSQNEIQQLQEQYSLEYTEYEIEFTLKDVQLFYSGYNYNLGNYTFKIENDGTMYCKKFISNYSILQRKDSYKHLYIKGKDCCLSTYIPLIKKALFFGNLSEVFMLVRTWLSYDGGSGYISIEDFLFKGYCPICNRELNENGNCYRGCDFKSKFIDLGSLTIRYCDNCGEELDDYDECPYCSRRCYKCGELLDSDDECPYCSRCGECDRLLDEDGYCPICNYCSECESLLDSDGICPVCQRCEHCGEILNDDGYCNECDYCQECTELKDDCTCDDEDEENEDIDEEDSDSIDDYGIDDGSQLKLFDELNLKLIL